MQAGCKAFGLPLPKQAAVVRSACWELRLRARRGRRGCARHAMHASHMCRSASPPLASSAPKPHPPLPTRGHAGQAALHPHLVDGMVLIADLLAGEPLLQRLQGSQPAEHASAAGRRPHQQQPQTGGHAKIGRWQGSRTNSSRWQEAAPTADASRVGRPCSAAVRMQGRQLAGAGSHLGLGGSTILIGTADVDAVVAARAAEAGVHISAAGRETRPGQQVGRTAGGRAAGDAIGRQTRRTSAQFFQAGR